jgi:hypothetical protein
MNPNLSLDLDFDFDDAAFSKDKNPENKKAASAVKTKLRHQARTAHSLSALHEALGEFVAEGESVHILSGGNIDTLNFLDYILQFGPADFVAISTWCMYLSASTRLSAWIGSGEIGHLDIYAGEIFPGTYTEAHAAITVALKNSGHGRVCIFRNHSKILLAKGKNYSFVIESSGNVNQNMRTENFTILHSAEILDHHKKYLDGITAFNRDFDDWKPFLC